jgi:hypothetical protein
LVFLSARSRVIADSIEFLSIEPKSGILGTGEFVKVNFRYNLTSVESAEVGAAPVSGKVPWESRRYSPCTITNGVGEGAAFFSLSCPALVTAVNMYASKNGKSIPNLSCPHNFDLKIRWVDKRYPAISPDPAYKSIWMMAIDSRFPHAEELYADMASNAVDSLVLWRGTWPTNWWTIHIGPDVDVSVAQHILGVCLGSTTNIARIRTKQRDIHESVNGDVQITSAEKDDQPPMPANLLAKLLQSGITKEEFERIARDWNELCANQHDEALRQDVLQRRAVTNAVNTILDAFGAAHESRVPDAVPTNGLIAYYGFEKDDGDASGFHGRPEMRNTTFVENSLYLNGDYDGGIQEGSKKAYRLNVPVPMLRYELCTVSLAFKPLDFDRTTDGSNSRRVNIVTGGGMWLPRWFDLDVSSSGNLELAFNDRAFQHEFSNAAVCLNEWNSITCSIDLSKRVVILYLNGMRLPDLQLPNEFVLDVIGNPSHAKAKLFSFTNYGNGTVLHGYIRDLIVYDRALSPEEIEQLETAVEKTHPPNARVSAAARHAKQNSRIPSDAGQDELDRLEKAADGGDSKAQFQMGELCYTGANKMIPIDNVEAVYWYLRAAAQNHPKAKQMLENIQKQSLVPEADVEKARKRLQDETKSSGAGKPSPDGK